MDNAHAQQPDPLRWRIAQRLELSWWKRYLRGRTPEEYLAWKRGYWQAFLDRIGDAPPAAGERVLDAGCGPAGVFTAIDTTTVDAVDPLIEAYECDLPHFSRSRYAHVRFRTGRIEDLDAPDAYQRIYCLNAINHVHDLDAACAALVRSLHPGGTLYLSVDAHRYPCIKHLLRMAPFDILHPHQHDAAEYEHLLTSRGCTVTRQLRIGSGALFDYILLVAHRIST